jgi:hypothetical protein
MGLPTLQQALLAVYYLAFELMGVFAMVTGFTIRSLMAKGVSLPAAIKQLTLLRPFWIQVVCTTIALAGMGLAEKKKSKSSKTTNDV